MYGNCVQIETAVNVFTPCSCWFQCHIKICIHSQIYCWTSRACCRAMEHSHIAVRCKCVYFFLCWLQGHYQNLYPLSELPLNVLWLLQGHGTISLCSEMPCNMCMHSSFLLPTRSLCQMSVLQSVFLLYACCRAPSEPQSTTNGPATWTSTGCTQTLPTTSCRG